MSLFASLARSRSVVAFFVLAITLVACAADVDTDEQESQSSELGARVCAKKATVPGIDVSAWQGAVDFAKVKSAGKRFVVVRVGDGLNKDKRFAANWKGVAGAGLVRGVYQFFRPAKDPIAQAERLLADVEAAGGFAGGDLPAVLDLEDRKSGLSAKAITAAAKKWLARVEEKTGKRPIVYTSAGYAPYLTTGLERYPLWVANYGAKCPSMPKYWSEWTMWQSSETGRVAGIEGNVDLNVFHGTISDLAALAGGTKPTTENESEKENENDQQETEQEADPNDPTNEGSTDAPEEGTRSGEPSEEDDAGTGASGSAGGSGGGG